MHGSLLLICLVFPAQAESTQSADALSKKSTTEKSADTVAEKSVADATKALVDKTKRLVRQLNADQASQRNAAEAALVELGPDVLSHLPAVNARTPTEVKERLGRVRTALEMALATSAAEPSQVTLKGEMSLADALQSLEKQTGNRVTSDEEQVGTVKVDFDKVPYWRALDQILDQAGLSVDENGGESNTLVLRAASDGEVRRADAATYSGVFRFEPIRMESRRDLRDPGVNGLRLSVNVSWEPRIKPILLRQALDSLTITADKGDSLSFATARGALNASAANGVPAVELILPIGLPSRDVRLIESLKGTLTAVVPGSVETFKFGALESAHDVEMRIAGVTVTLERARKNAELYEVRIGVTYDEANNALESHRGWIFNNEAYIEDSKGARVTDVGLQATRQGKNEAGLAYLFALPDGLKGCSFVYKTPTLILNLPVEYELKNIQLP
ncbi:MAG TPA: hypothetical protein QF564_30890 [Pirellulaceae bacterium]|nr:hypothetical protein [Pirellulaceae bacterium]